MKLTLTCGMLALLSGCAYIPLQHTATTAIQGGTTVPVFLDNTLSPVIQRSALLAVDMWNVSLNGHLHLQVVPSTISSDSLLQQAEKENGILLLGVDSSSSGMMQAGHVYKTVAITYPFGHDKPSALIYLAVDTLIPSHATSIIAHELGHALGADDRDEGPSVLMSRKWTRSHCIDYDAAQQVSHSFGWEIDTLNYCEE